MKTFVHHSILLLLLIIFCIGFASCKKKVLEIQAVISIADISLSGEGNVKYFSFPTISNGFAAPENKNYIYATLDAGKTWSKKFPAGVSSTSKCKGIEFFDNNHGMVLMGGNVFTTTDGGNNWVLKTTASDIALSNRGIGIVIHDDYNTCSIKKTTNMGASFFSSGNVQYDGDYSSCRATGDNVFVFGTTDFYSDVTHGINTYNGQQTTFCYTATSDTYPVDIYIDSLIQCSVGKQGLVEAFRGYNCHDRVYYQHTLDYNSVDGYNGLAVAVGNKTIVSNKITTENERWTEVFNSNGQGFKNVFYKIRFINQNTFIVSGSNGLIWRAII